LVEVNRLIAKGKTIVVSVDSAPGIFLAASECVEREQEFRLPRVPPEWKARPPRVHLLPFTKDIAIKMANGHTLIDRIEDVNAAVRAAFLVIGCEVVEGAPTRFERKDVI